MMGVRKVGARCPLGLDALQTAMAVRAGLLEPRSCDFLDKRNNRIGCVRARWLPDDLHGVERWLALAVPALAEASRGWGEEPLPLWVAVPEADRPDDDPAVGGMLDELARGAELVIAPKKSGLVRGGQAAFVEALLQAERQLEAGAPAAIVGGVDSYFHPDTLRWLDEGYRLHAPRALDGFIPGEGAAFALLEREGDARVEITQVDQAIERSVAADEPNLAQALTALMREALGDDAAAWVLSDINGEAHRVSEWEKVAIRCGLRGERVVHQRLPGDLGDVGAATGALMLAVASSFWHAGCAPRDRALMMLASERGERGVFVAERRRAA